MDVNFIGKNTEITGAMEDYARNKLSKLSRYLPAIDDLQVEITEEQTRSPEDRFTVQVTVRTKGALFRGEERSQNVNAAIDNVLEVLARRIKRHKDKRNKKGKGVSLARQAYETEDVLQNEEDQLWPEVVRVKRFPVRSMTVDEAAEQMELLSHDFFLFVNAENGSLNLVYRRKDGNYGLIEPQLD